MLKNYILIALRNISKKGIFSVINIAGLSIGVACSILILLWVYHEISYDRFHPDHKRIHRLAFMLEVDGTSMEGPVAMAPLAAVLTETFPEVDEVVRILKRENVNMGVRNEKFIEPVLLIADSSFFKVFGFEMEIGDPLTVLQKPYSIVITRELAEKFFGQANPVGETLKLYNSRDYTITGIAANPPSNSHITFRAITSFSTLYETSSPGAMDEWLSLSYYTYIKFNDNYAEELFFTRLNGLFEARFGEQAREYGLILEPFLQPVASVYLNSRSRFELDAAGNKSSVYIFSAVAVFILFLACINFVNLSTARASLRSKEVGVRKVIGASRPALVWQFLGESFTYTFVAFLLAIPLIELGLPFFNNIANVQLAFLNTGNLKVLSGLPVLLLFIGLLAGSYPAFVLSGFNPLKTIKGENRISSGRSWIRSGLTVFQMVISITLVICTIFVWKQLNYINSRDPGFDKYDRIIVPLTTTGLREKSNVTGQRLMQVPGVSDITFSNSYPGMEFNGTRYKPEGFTEPIVGSYLNADENYLDVMGIRLIEGRNFNADFGADNMSVLINETAARSWGWNDPLERTLDRGRGDNEFDSYNVIGVVADFHFRSMHQVVEPLIIHLQTVAPGYMTIKTGPEDLNLTIAGIRSAWEGINHDDPFEYTLLSDAWDVHYRSEHQLGKVFAFFSVLAFIIAALGLYGLSSFMVENKIKEIGVKKVFGASVSIIVAGFFKNFTLWLLAANIVSWVLAWHLVSYWLDMFAYKIPVNNPLVFLLAAVLSVLVVLIASGYQSIRAASIDPARSLRYE
jgi:putative ABC transport system permease protein